MGSTERSLLQRVQTDLQAIDGTGSYNYDFTATDAVILGTEAAGVSPRSPGIYIFPMTISTNQAKGRTPLNRFDRIMMVQIDVWVPRTTETAGNAMLAALDAQSDVMRALENDRSLNNLCHDIEIDASAYDGIEIELPGYGVATLRMTITYSEVAGA